MTPLTGSLPLKKASGSAPSGLGSQQPSGSQHPSLIGGRPRPQSPLRPREGWGRPWGGGGAAPGSFRSPRGNGSGTPILPQERAVGKEEPDPQPPHTAPRRAPAAGPPARVAPQTGPSPAAEGSGTAAGTRRPSAAPLGGETQRRPWLPWWRPQPRPQSPPCAHRPPRSRRPLSPAKPPQPPAAQYGEQEPPQWSSGNRGELHIHGRGWAGVARMGLPTLSRAAPASPRRGGRWLLPRASAAAARPQLPVAAAPRGRPPSPPSLTSARSPPALQPCEAPGASPTASGARGRAAATPSAAGTGAAGRRGSSRRAPVGFEALLGAPTRSAAASREQAFICLGVSAF